MLLAVGAARSSPGVTTVALALAAAWPVRPVTLVEADPDGGVLAVRAGAPVQPGLADLVAQARTGTVDLATVSTPHGAGWRLVVSGPGAGATVAALRAGGEALGHALADAPGTVIADVGRLRPDTPATDLVARAALVVVVTRPTPDDLAALAAWCDGRDGRPAAVVLTGDGPYRPGEVADGLGVEVVGHLPHDARAAAALHRGVVADRRPLVRAARQVAERLAELLPVEEVRR